MLASGSKYTNEYVYEAGNLKEVKAYDMTGKNTSKYTYEYFTDKKYLLNLFMQQISDDIFPNERLGKKNKNLVKQFSNIDVAGDTLSMVKYTYIQQDKKDILVQKERDVLNEFETVIIYHFKKP